MLFSNLYFHPKEQFMAIISWIWLDAYVGRNWPLNGPSATSNVRWLGRAYWHWYLGNNASNFIFQGFNCSWFVGKHFWLHISPQKKSPMVWYRMILAAYWRGRNVKLNVHQNAASISPLSLEQCGLWRRLVETKFCANVGDEFAASKIVMAL